mmetsp:Transcript_2938/g.6807  ORF Transcript_2938/g.6807 Transcript_2938/m.6807 type:complete len:428 (-) Transcript_2938:225-1508(-)
MMVIHPLIPILACCCVFNRAEAFAVPSAERFIRRILPARPGGSRRSRGGKLNLVVDDDEECSIDNLDACIDQGKSVDECIIETLNDCMPIEEQRAEPFGGITGDAPQGSMDQDSLRRFLAMPVIEVNLALLVVVSSFLVGLGTLQSLPPTVAMITKNGELIISAIFTIEYAMRWALSGFSAEYVIQPLAIIDLGAILPGLIKIASAMGVAVPPSLMGGALINLRLLRILRLQRVLVDYDTFSKFELALGLNPSDARPYQLQLARIIISIFTLLSVTAGLIYSAEHIVNPDIPDYFTALYFTLTTLTTVGFGDISPVTTAGRWIVGGSILVGSVVIPAQAAALVEALLDREGEKQDNGAESSLMDDRIRAMKGDSNGGEILSLSIQSRMDRLEGKVEDTNMRLDQVLAILEARVALEDKEEEDLDLGT